MYDALLTPFRLGPTEMKNRVFNPPHGTTLGHNGVVTDALIAYHQTRARGGVGLIILESMTFHPSYGFKDAFLYAGSDDIIPGLERLGKACRQYDTPVFGQLFHAGRAVRLSHDGSRPLVYSASDMPDDRYRVTPVAMPNEMVWEVIDHYCQAAGRLVEAGLEGVEILAGMGYLIAQFLNPATNQREDEFGGTTENRLRLLREILSGVRKKIGQGKTLGVRITLDEKTESGMDSKDMIRICERLESDQCLDYFSVISGSSASPAGWIHVFPPMAVPPAFVADDAAKLKQAISTPVLVAGRINQPQTAQAIIAGGKADMVGMVRALITDPDFVNKLSRGEGDTIRACIGCNQACVGHRLAHHPVSCIQNPVAGREHRYPAIHKVPDAKTIVVIGGGPAGMKAAVTAAQRGHRVSLFERTGSLGGQVCLAEKLPGRAEFGGVTTNLVREMQSESIELCLNTRVTPQRIHALNPDAIVIAIGAVPRLPDVAMSDVPLIDAWSVIRGEVRVGQNVVIADWSCDWTGLGVAQLLAERGHSVRLVSGASVAGESLQGIVRDQWIGCLHTLEVELIPFAKFYGAEAGAAFFQHMIGGAPIVCEQVDTIVSCYAPQINRDCEWLMMQKGHLHQAEVIKVGDAVAPRTVEEAIMDGLDTMWWL